eukprot:15471781-Alexandrium_andersonii.AAC.1
MQLRGTPELSKWHVHCQHGRAQHAATRRLAGERQPRTCRHVHHRARQGVPHAEAPCESRRSTRTAASWAPHWAGSASPAG